MKNLFTLIELLVVIAIMAILAGILLPALNSVREKSASVICSQQIKQYAQGLQGFANDNKERVPYYTRDSKGPFHWKIVPYLGYNKLNMSNTADQRKVKILQCASDRIRRAGSGVKLSYGVSVMVFYTGNRRLNRYRRPGRIPGFWETWNNWHIMDTNGAFIDGYHNVKLFHEKKRRTNAGYLDGHSEQWIRRPKSTEYWLDSWYK